MLTYKTVIIRYRSMSSVFLALPVLLALLACLPVRQPTTIRIQRLDREFQAAVAQYDSGQYAEAAAQLENLLREAPESFEVQELLGLVYSAQSQDAKATHTSRRPCS